MSLRRIKIAWVIVAIALSFFLIYDFVVYPGYGIYPGYPEGPPFVSPPTLPLWMQIAIFLRNPYILAFLLLLFIFVSAWTGFRLIQNFHKRRRKDKNAS